MVSEAGQVMLYDLLLLAEKGKTPLEQMTTQQRQSVFAALAVVVLLGIVMIFFVAVSARMVRRYVRQLPIRSPGTNPLSRGDDWATKPMIETDDVEDGG